MLDTKTHRELEREKKKQRERERETDRQREKLNAMMFNYTDNDYGHTCYVKHNKLRNESPEKTQDPGTRVSLVVSTAILFYLPTEGNSLKHHDKAAKKS